MHCIGKARQRATFGILGGHGPLAPPKSAYDFGHLKRILQCILGTVF